MTEVANGRAEAARLASEAQSAAGQGDLPRAASLLARALTLDPDNVHALAVYAWVGVTAGASQPALAAARRWAMLEPGSAAARNLHGVACRECGDLEGALRALREAVALDPSLFDARVNLANALRDAGDLPAAREHAERAVALRPDDPAAHNALGNAMRDLREHALALDAYRRAAAAGPAHANAQSNLANALRDTGRTVEALAAYRRALALAPDDAQTWSNFLLALAADDATDAASIAREHRAFGERFAARIRPLPPVERPRNDRLRVGYVSSDFCRHAAASFAEPLLFAHDRSRFEVFAYYNRPRGDDVTARLRDRVEHFVPVAGMPDLRLAERIRADRIDVLVDLNGHTAGNRLPLFFLRPAPVQATWMGYLGPTGVPTIDWRIGDPYVDRPGLPAAEGSERLWRLPRTLWCWRPPDDAPEVAPSPCGDDGVVTFGCLNSPAKISPAALDAWAHVVASVPGSRLVLHVPGDDGRLADIAARFEARGVDPARIAPWRRGTMRDYLALYAGIDVALDTFPYTGGATTCDALWMGVPVVTLASDRPFGRTGASILAQLDLDDLVAAGADDYVATAIALASDRGRLRGLRSGLRARMRASPLCDEAAFARDFEAALIAMADGGGRAR